ncbi:hypothetical protein EV385_2543 [Krasilnikovia cinnamomea]|uniref:Uncharacterized protein n=1 Tax=Krasilnikovia cinnamomea TaxID=349313 RepID=A0A4Q7ZIS2_9ACTN|nr:hypothetical protein [Krasilnikovia cinnamomea]RZU50760.1 hypothetical protein EV385_2543 [Krasilnikovia cinnamomea]
MRGGLDDALDKLARRDELRRRAAGEATPAAVTELVEAIAAVVGRNPELAVTVGVEGAGDPVLLHFAVEDGVVQVSADHTVAVRTTESGPTARPADFDIAVGEPIDEPADPGTPPFPQGSGADGLWRAGEQHRYGSPMAESAPQPMPKPVPLKVKPEDTEQAARRLAALIRDNPTLLRDTTTD